MVDEIFKVDESTQRPRLKEAQLGGKWIKWTRMSRQSRRSSYIKGLDAHCILDILEFFVYSYHVSLKENKY